MQIPLQHAKIEIYSVDFEITALVKMQIQQNNEAACTVVVRVCLCVQTLEIGIGLMPVDHAILFAIRIQQQTKSTETTRID